MPIDTPSPAVPPQSLSGVRIVDLTHHIMGPVSTRLLADQGADVIKVERTGTGDPARHMGPFLNDSPSPEASGLFYHLNTNKRSITLDLKSRAGRRVLLALAGQAHILVESFSPRVMPSLGLGFGDLHVVNPSLLVTSISNFGQHGPYRDYKSSEIVSYAMAGPMYATGMPDREPMKLGENVIQYHAGASAATATALAFYGVEARGVGDHLDISLFRAQASSQDRRTTMLVAYQYTGEVNERRLAGSTPASGVRPVSDGYICMGAGMERLPLAIRLIGHPELLEDPRFKDSRSRAMPGRSDEFDEYLLPWLLERSKQEAFTELQGARIPAGPLYDTADLLKDPHLQVRDVWTEVEQPAGTLAQTGRPFIMSATPWRTKRPAPKLGQHNDEVLRGMLGFSRNELAALRRSGVV